MVTYLAKLEQCPLTLDRDHKLRGERCDDEPFLRFLDLQTDDDSGEIDERDS